MEKTLFSCKDYTILKVGIDFLYDIIKFVVTENYVHHSLFPNSTKILHTEIERIYEEELSYSNYSEYFIVRNNIREIIGCIRVFKWDKTTPTPMQKLFHISPLEIVHDNSTTSFWHIGRFAINSKVGFSTITLLKQLMILAVAPIMREEDGYMIAEIDSHLLRVMNALGIKTHQIANPIIYLASETIPIYTNKNGLYEFFKRYYPLLVA